jgi:hypothetical protein
VLRPAQRPPVSQTMNTSTSQQTCVCIYIVIVITNQDSTSSRLLLTVYPTQEPCEAKLEECGRCQLLPSFRPFPAVTYQGGIEGWSGQSRTSGHQFRDFLTPTCNARLRLHHCTIGTSCSSKYHQIYVRYLFLCANDHGRASCYSTKKLDAINFIIC